jgi:Ca-activated chloride channel homolog
LKILFTILLLFITHWLSAQYYYRGELIDEKNKQITNATIFIHSSRINVSSGSSGGFGIMSTKKAMDTFTIITENYEKLTTPVFVDKHNIIKLTLLPALANMRKNKLTTFIKNLKIEQKKATHINSETYSELIENDFVNTQLFPNTGFAINADKAAYANVRRFINSNAPVPIAAVRIDEMINYFGLNNTHPNNGATFNISSQITQCPWNEKNALLFLNVSAKKINLDSVPHSNLVFLIDNSGSMDLQNRMPLLKSAFKALIKNIRPEDKITIITYGGGVNVLADALDGNMQDSLITIIESMQAGGDTPGEDAIKIAYQKAKQHFITKGNNRIILATDGDFNVGIANEEELQRMIVLQSQAGVYLTCLGLGMGNYKDSKIEVLAKKGNGNFAYLDTEKEAEKVLVQELTQTLYSVADDVFMNMEFDVKNIANYRLIGYDNKANALEDSTSKLEGGQVGSGYSSIIIFELSLTNSIDLEQPDAYLDKEIGTLSIKYIDPITKINDEITHKSIFNFKPLLSLPNHYGFATAVAMFGSYVKSSKYINNIKIEDIKNLALKTHDPSQIAQKELITILDKAETIYEPNAKKRKRKTNLQVTN